MELDDGFKKSDKILQRLEKKIHKEYAKAAKEMTAKTRAYFEKFVTEDEEKRRAYNDGEISKKEFVEWRKRKMLQGKYYVGIKNRLTNDMVNTDKLAMSYVYSHALDTYALNMNFGTYQIEADSQIDTGFTLYNREAVLNMAKNNPDLLPKNTNPKVDIPKDKQWNRQHIQSAITQGILQGETLAEVAKRLQNVTSMDERSAIRNARSAMTSAQNAGRLDSMRRASKRGIALKKVWLAVLDSHTRASHRALDGEVRDLEEEFSNGLMMPGDPNGDPSEYYNCRCALVKEYDKYATDWLNLENRRTEKLNGMSYEDWKKERSVSRETKKTEDVPAEAPKKRIEVKDLNEPLQKALYNYTDGHYSNMCEYSQYLVNGDKDISPTMRSLTKERWEREVLAGISAEERKHTEEVLQIIQNQPIIDEPLVRMERGAQTVAKGDIMSFGLRSTSASDDFIKQIESGNMDGFDVDLLDRNNNGMWTEYRFVNSKNLDVSPISAYKEQNERIIAGNYKVLSVETVEPIKPKLQEVNVSMEDLATDIQYFTSKKGTEMVKYMYEERERTEPINDFKKRMVTKYQQVKGVWGRTIITLEVDE